MRHKDLGGELTGLAIGAGIAVHRELGPGLDEPDYEKAFCAELKAMGIPHLHQEPVPLVYKGVKLDCGYRLDVVIDWKLIIELKAVEALIPVHEAQLLTYLRLARVELGLLMNFEVAALKEGIRRRVLSQSWVPPVATLSTKNSPSFDPLTQEVLQAAIEVHRHLGPGLLRSAYEECICYELAQKRIPFERKKTLPLRFRELSLQDAEIELLVDGRLPIVCLSIDKVTPVHNARLLARLRQGEWPAGLILNFNVPLLRNGVHRLVNSRR